MIKTGDDSYCMTWKGRQDSLANYRMLWVYGDSNAEIIQKYNETIGAVR